MNIFALHNDPRTAAKYHCDSHVVKMILETAQMLSTAHRVLDGLVTTRKSKTGRNLKHWAHPKYEAELYKATHVNHPCSVWVRETADNYLWAYQLFYWLSMEYTKRYGKRHATFTKLRDPLALIPDNIPIGDLTPFATAMPDDITGTDPVAMYRTYYREYKQPRIKMTWTKVEQPQWMVK